MIFARRVVVLGFAAASVGGCGSADSEALAPVPGANDLAIHGIWAPRNGRNEVCDFERPDFEAAEEVFVRLYDPEEPTTHTRALPIRIGRAGNAPNAPSELRLTGARVRWVCREGDNPYRWDWWPAYGLDPEQWSYLPLELPGWERPFCADDIDIVEPQTLQTAPLTLASGEEGTAWVEIIDPTTRRTLAEYEEMAVLASFCLGACPSNELCRLEGPLEEFNSPHCARFIARHQEFLGATEPAPSSIGEATFYESKTAAGGLLMHPELVLIFEDESGFEYTVQGEFEIHLAFSPWYVARERPGLYSCHERDIGAVWVR